MSEQSSIRIIGGKWRSRKVIFESKDTLRPTPDRVRETLFNWLAPHLPGAVCLDLYAGSGVLSLEALSRGAKAATTVDIDRANIINMEQNREKLQANEMSIVHKNVLDMLAQKPMVADIAFVGPPYKLRLLKTTFELLENNDWLHANSFIYFDQDEPLDPDSLPATWSIWRQSKAGRVYFYLAIKER